VAEALTFLAITLLVGFMILKAYATRTLVQLRDEASRQLADERHSRQQKEREESVLEGLQARVMQLQEDHARYLEESEELTAEIERVDAELRRVQGEDGNEDEDEDEDTKESAAEGSPPADDESTRDAAPPARSTGQPSQDSPQASQDPTRPSGDTADARSPRLAGPPPTSQPPPAPRGADPPTSEA
jgi:uncharacterized protein YlxW (UPF0749 family)